MVKIWKTDFDTKQIAEIIAYFSRKLEEEYAFCLFFICLVCPDTIKLFYISVNLSVSHLMGPKVTFFYKDEGQSMFKKHSRD